MKKLLIIIYLFCINFVCYAEKINVEIINPTTQKVYVGILKIEDKYVIVSSKLQSLHFKLIKQYDTEDDSCFGYILENSHKEICALIFTDGIATLNNCINTRYKSIYLILNIINP